MSVPSADGLEAGMIVKRPQDKTDAQNDPYPNRTLEYFNHHLDTRVWDEFQYRPDDIMVCSYAKSGTTWTQQIVSQLLTQGQEGVEVAASSPWLELRFPPRPDVMAAVNAMPTTQRRYLKSHSPVEALNFDPRVKYLVPVRSGRDLIMSLHNHMASANDLFYSIVNNPEGLVGPQLEKPTKGAHAYYTEYMQSNGDIVFPYSVWDFLRSWWAIRHQPNVKFVHFNNLKKDLDGEMRAIAAFLGVQIADAETWRRMVHHCTFEYMHAHAEQFVPLRGAVFEGGAQSFIHKGTNDRWKEILSPQECEAYEVKARKELGEDLFHYSETGQGL